MLPNGAPSTSSHHRAMETNGAPSTSSHHRAMETRSERGDSVPSLRRISSSSSSSFITGDDLFGERIRTDQSLSPEQALAHMIKVMMGTGMLSLPLAFKYSGLWLGLILTVIICSICIYCTRQLVFAAHFVCSRKRLERLDYANVMRSAVEMGPSWIKNRGYMAKTLVNVNMFIAQFGFCSVYFVFMADNLKQAGWIALLLIPVLGLCTIRKLNALAPLAFIANVVYVLAVCIVSVYLITDPKSSADLPAIGNLSNLPLFFGTVIFAFEGVAVVLPIENQMDRPQYFIAPNGVLNTACLLVLALYCFIGFFGYLRFGNGVMDTITLNLPNTVFYQSIKILFVFCILVSYPLQFYVPMERVEKWISRKVQPNRQTPLVYGIRFSAVLLTCVLAELVPHLALFISLVGAFASTALSLVFPPLIELLCSYANSTLTVAVWARNMALLLFAMTGFLTGTYASLVQIVAEFGK